MSGFANSLIGVSLGGYTVKRMIARGGMGIVYEGVQESLGRRVAVKVLYPHLGEDDSFRDRFEREARAIAQLRHPNIVRIIDFGFDQGLHYMVMDLIDGPSLRDELARRHDQNQPFTTEETLNVIEKIAAALTYAHGRGYVHRDVKPANVMLDEQGDIYLTDFGLVRLADAQGMTMTGAIVGTPEYMAPEQSLGTSDITPAADQYSLAVVAYQLFVGRVPFRAPTPVGVIQKHISEPPPAPHTILPWFPPGVERALMRALSKDPEARYANVNDFFRELRNFADGMDLSAVVMPSPSDAAPTAQTPPMVAAFEPPVTVAPDDLYDATLAEPAPRHDPDGRTEPIPVVRPEPEDSVAPAAIAASTAAGASAATPVDAPVPVDHPSALGRPPETMGTIPPPPSYPVASTGTSGERNRTPLIAAIVALALILVVGGIAAATFLTGDDDGPSNPGVVADATNTPGATPTSEQLAVATETANAVEIPSPTATNEPPTPTLEPTATNEPVATPTQAPVQITATAPRRLIPTPTPFTINLATPTPAPTPESDPDDFVIEVDERFVDSTRLFTGETPYGAQVRIDQGRYGITLGEGTWQSIAIDWIDPVTDGILFATTSLEGDGVSGLIGRSLTHSDGTFSFYVCWMQGDGSAGCHVSVNSNWTELIRADPGTVPVLDLNEMFLIIRGQTIYFMVNDVIVASLTDSSVATGSWGVYAEGISGTFTAWYTNVTLARYTN